MRIAVLGRPGAFDVQDAPVPEIQSHDVLVRVAACGVCGSELDQWTGAAAGIKYPRYPGHEVSGVVERVGGDAGPWEPGNPVAVWVTERGFAEYVAVPAAHCVSAGEVKLDLALGEPLSCAVNAVELAAPSIADDVVVIGAGFMGNLVQLLAARRGPRHLIVSDVRPDALERAGRLGASRVVDATRERLSDVIAQLTAGAGADVTFEVTGAQAALTTAGEITRMSGTIAIVGFHQGAREIPMGQWNWKAFTIANAHFREPTTIMRGMRVGMRLLRSGLLSLEGLVTNTFELADIDKAFRTAQEKPEGFVKATVLPR